MNPLFSVLLPTFKTQQDHLRACLESVLNQDFDDWELCIVDDASHDDDITRIILDITANDDRVRFFQRDSNGGIARSSDDALNLATGEFCILLDHDDLLEPDAFSIINKYLESDPKIDFLYTDEFHLYPDGTETEFRKPSWSPERLRAQNYICHLSTIRTSLLRSVGGFRNGFDGAQDHDLVLRVSERARKITHIPISLYHWRVHPSSYSASTSTRETSFDAGVKAVQEHLDRLGLRGVVSRTPYAGVYRTHRDIPASAKVSIVIPSRGSSAYVWGRHTIPLVDCVQAIIERSTFRNFEIIVVLDRSAPTDLPSVLRRAAGSLVKIVWFEHPFNFSHKINLGVAHSSGDFILLLNDDVLIINDDWCEPMLGLAMQDDVGLVGNMLLFENSTIQHAGHRYVDGLPTHVGFREPIVDGGPGGSYVVEREVSGVTAACCMLRREIFEEVGGLSTRFGNNYNDVDFSLKIRNRGYRILWTPYSQMFHFESLTRSATVSDAELALLDLRWHRELRNDVYDAPIPLELIGLSSSTERRPSRLRQKASER
jgi:O-antigen biosynthesis protein